MLLLQLKVVVWKNFIIRKNHLILTVVEFALPTLLFLLFAYLTSLMCRSKDKFSLDATYNNPKTLEFNDNSQLYYAPNTTFYKDIVERVQLRLPYLTAVKGFSTSDALLQHYRKTYHSSTIAIVFNGDNQKTLNYAIRMGYQYYSRYIKAELYKSPFRFNPGFGTPYSATYLRIQKELDMAFIEKISGKNLDRNVTVMIQEFPYPPNKPETIINDVFVIFLPVITLFSFISISPAVLKRVVEEKYTGTKELLKMVGMKPWMLWMGWFIHGMIPMLFSVVCIVLLLKIPLFGANCYSLGEFEPLPPIEYTDGSVLFVFLLLYCMAATVFYFAISSLFNKPTMAMVAGFLIWILSYFVPKYGLNLDETANKYSWSLNMVLNLFPNMALHYGYLTIFLYEQRELGLQWNNFYKSSSGGTDDLSMLNILLMLILDIIFYMSFTLYMDNVNPGKYGVRKHFLYPIQSFIKICKRTVKESELVEPLCSDYMNCIEECRGLVKGIEIRDLVKRYGHKTAVNNLTLNIYQNQITVLLGHNGAGKSTTMSMITGMLNATSGVIKMNGKDIRDNTEEIRKSLGLCPQHNLLFTDLTVGEHLVLFAKLKGKTSKEAEKEMLELLEKLHLSEKQHAMAHTLSGGMKRKLCLGMAVIADSKILILDEPTSGMDPESRRELWDLLLAWRGEKTILITTHFMEEADALGDWIAIMADGKLQCHGTPIYLKKTFDTGYHLSLIVADDATIEERDAIGDNIKKYIDCADLKECNGNNMMFVLRFDDNSKIANLLAFLEEKKEEFKIVNISVTVTTLEDVFLKVKQNSGVDVVEDLEWDIQDNNNTTSGMKLFMSRLTALIVKKLQFYKKKIWAYLIPALIGIVIFMLAIYLSSEVTKPDEVEGINLKLQLDTYPQSTVYYNGTTRNYLISNMKTAYRSLVESTRRKAVEVKDVQQEIMNEGIKNILYYKEHLIVGAQIESKNNTRLIALYNGIATHSAPISLNLITNTLAKVYLGDQFSIRTSSWPLPSIDSYSPPTFDKNVVMVLWAVLVPIGFLIIIGSFIVFPHIELSTNFVQLQSMCGVRPHFYWLVNYFVDMTVYLIISLVTAGITVLVAPYIRAKEFGILFLILASYGAANMAFMYLFSRKKSAAGGFALFVTMSIFLGMIITITFTGLTMSRDVYRRMIGQGLQIFFTLIFPQVGLVHGLLMFSDRAVANYESYIDCKISPQPCCKGGVENCKHYESYMSSLLGDILLLIFSSILFIVVNILLDTYFFKKVFSKMQFLICNFWKKYSRNSEQGHSQNVDDSTDQENNCLTANNLHKAYHGNLVVKNISFTLNEKECLGILGVNGAGKTTTFRMLTRDEIADSGNVKIFYNKYKKPITIDQSKYFENIGYCPQIDALNFVLTGRQILTFIAKLRGVDDSQVVDKFLKLFELVKYADTPCGHYSGGNKRKLSLAVALIGFPKFVLLDEPTCGVDPSSRRKFWNLIRTFKEKKELSFILTSHSMAECEALCNYLKIMKEGRFEKEGTISDLKKQHGGFNVKLKLVNRGLNYSASDPSSSNHNWTVKVHDAFNDIHELKEHFTKKYHGVVKDEHAGLLYIHVNDKTMKWSTIFKIVERIKLRNSHLIEDYTISEASLEDIFLTVARSKIDKEEMSKKSKKEKRKMEAV